MRVLAGQYGFSRSILQRHTLHVYEAMQLAKKNSAIKEGKTAYEQFMEMLGEAEKKYRNSKKQLQVQWFREWRTLMMDGFKLGMEEGRRREQQVHKDVTPGVLEIINKEFEE